MKKRYGKTAAGLLALLIMALCLTLTGCSEIFDIAESVLTEVAESAEEAESKQGEEAENSDVANSEVTKSKSANNDAIKKDLRFRNKKL